MIAPMTDYQIAEVALSNVLPTLPCERKLLEQANHTALPFMFGDGSIHGPAADNAAVLVEYPNDWQGLAVSINAGKLSFWFFYVCDTFHERAMACLGNQPSLCAAIDAAVQHVKSDLKQWNGHRVPDLIPNSTGIIRGSLST